MLFFWVICIANCDDKLKQQDAHYEDNTDLMTGVEFPAPAREGAVLFAITSTMPLEPTLEVVTSSRVAAS